MGVIVFLAILGIIFLISLVSGLAARNSDAKLTAFGIAGAAFVFFGLTWLFSSVFYVEARTVGIVSSFGKPNDKPADVGLNISTPWSEVTHFSTGNQPMDFDGDQKIGFKLTNADGSADGEAWINFNGSWQIAGDDKAVELWKDRKEFDRVKNEVVLPIAQSATVGVMGKYSADDANNSANVAKFNVELMTEINKALNPKGIRVESIAVRSVDLSDKVKERLERKNADKVETERAVIQQGTAKIEADTNKILQENLTPLVIQAKCIELTNKWNDDNNGQLPAAWNCISPADFVTTNR